MITGFPYEELTVDVGAYAFATHRDATPKTVGLAQELAAGGPAGDASSTQARRLARQFDPFGMIPTVSARGKVVFVRPISDSRRDGRLRCFQVGSQEAVPAFCGNAAAAGAAILARDHACARLTLEARAGAAAVRIHAMVDRDGEGWTVQQSWDLATANTVHEEPGGAVRVAFLNPTWVVRDHEAFQVEWALRELAAAHGTAGKLVVVGEGEPIPMVRFYGVNGLHGSAPLTGLLTLSYLSERVAWIGEALREGQVRTPATLEDLPVAANAPAGRFRADLPPVGVELFPLRFQLESAA